MQFIPVLYLNTQINKIESKNYEMAKNFFENEPFSNVFYTRCVTAYTASRKLFTSRHFESRFVPQNFSMQYIAVVNQLHMQF